MSKTVLLLSSMALALLLVCGVVLAETVNCEGTSLDGPCLGTSGADTLYGTPYEDHIEGRGGSDKIYGFEGDYDQLQGDREYRTDQDGNDRVYGGPGTDNIIWLYGGADVAKGHGGRDTISLIDDNVDQQTGYMYRDTPNPGVDHGYGGSGADVINAVDGFRDVIDCGLNTDYVHFDEGLDELTNCEIRYPYTLPTPQN